MMAIIGFIVFLVGSDPMAQAVEFRSVKDCEDAIKAVRQRVEGTSVKIIKYGCIQAS
jgi:hypothetical protein